MRSWKPRCNIFGLAASCAYEKEGAVETEQEVKSEGAQYTNEGPRGPLSIWTTGVWEREAMIMRWAERMVVRTVNRYSLPKQEEPLNASKFLKPIPEPPKKINIIDRFLDKVYST